MHVWYAISQLLSYGLTDRILNPLSSLDQYLYIWLVEAPLLLDFWISRLMFTELAPFLSRHRAQFKNLQITVVCHGAYVIQGSRLRAFLRPDAHFNSWTHYWLIFINSVRSCGRTIKIRCRTLLTAIIILS